MKRLENAKSPCKSLGGTSPQVFGVYCAGKRVMNEELGGVKPEASLDVLNSGACVMYVISVIFSVTILIVKATL